MDPELAEIVTSLAARIEFLEQNHGSRIKLLEEQIQLLHARLKIDRRVLTQLLTAHRQTIEYLECKSALRDDAEFLSPN